MLCARECLDEIVDLYQSGPSVKGPELLERVADLFFVTADRQSADDRNAFGNVMERMAYAADPVTRARFAERISTAESAPIELIRRLARDDIFIARPILQYSPCLREGDLVSISSNAEQDHLKATAHRTNLTKPVTDIIVRRGNLGVLIAVISNTGAEFSTEALAHLSKAAELHGELQQMLNLRRNLTPGAIARLKRLTEVEFWQQMAEAILMTPEEIDESDISESAKTNVTDEDENLNGPEPEESDAEKSRQSETMKAMHASAEKILLESARIGAVEEAVEAFSKIAQLDKAMVEHCLFQAHISALMVLCKAHNFASATFNGLVQFRESQTGEPINDTIGLLRRYESMTPDTAQRIIRFSDKRRKVAKDTGEQASA